MRSLGARYALFTAATACSFVVAASAFDERLSLALGDWLCERSECAAPAVHTAAQRPLALPASAPADPARHSFATQEDP